MTQQGTVTISGFIGADPIGFGREGGPPACSFRVGCTRSHFDPASNAWKDHPTTWITVKAFRALAANARASLHKGDPVIVTGLLDTEQWQRDGVERSRLVLEANGIGHDLNLGVSDFHRSRSRMVASTDNSMQTAPDGESSQEHSDFSSSGTRRPDGAENGTGHAYGVGWTSNDQAIGRDPFEESTAEVTSGVTGESTGEVTAESAQPAASSTTGSPYGAAAVHGQGAEQGGDANSERARADEFENASF